MPDQYFGKYTGIVKDNRDNDKRGQLKLSVPTIFPEDELVLARPALPYGFFFVPENNAKVWVEFEGGDPDLPLWTGLQYVPGEWAAEGEANPPQMRVIKTASGHLLLFNDKEGNEAIEIHDGVNKHVLRMDKNGWTLEDGKNKHSIVLDQQGVTVKTQSGAKVELAAAGITIDPAGKPCNVKGSAVNLGNSPSGKVIRMGGGDQVIGNLGAPCVLLSLSMVTAS